MNKTRLIAIFLFIILSITLNSAPTENNKKNASSTIDHVLVYKDRALITRKTQYLYLKKGRHEIIMTNLPYSLKNDSVRAETTSEMKAKILDVEVRSFDLKKVKEGKIQNLMTLIKKLKNQRKKVRSDIRVIKFEKSYLYGVKTQFLQRTSSSEKTLVVKERTIKEYKRMMFFLTSALGRNYIKQNEKNNQLVKLNKKIYAKQQLLYSYNSSRSNLLKKKKVKIVMDVKSTTSLRVQLTYMNLNVKWKPSYDIRVVTGKKTTEFIGYSEVSHRSGEDWVNSKLSYSTAQPAVIGYLPELKALYVTARSGYNYRDRAKNYQKNIDDSKKTHKKMGSLVFHVPKRTTIPSDNSPHRTTISRNKFPVSFDYISIPRFSSNAYLRAVGKNTMDYPILQGNLNIFLDNSFVGSSNADRILPGEEFELNLSVNENIRVKRYLEEMKVFKPGMLSSQRRAQFSFVITVENFTKEKIKMNVVDQIPVSNVEEISIKDVNFSIAPKKKKKNGVCSWVMDMKPGEKKKIRIKFTIYYPKAKGLAFYKNSLKLNSNLMDLEKDENIKNKNDSFKKFRPRMQRKMY